MADHYATLGVRRGSSRRELVGAYRRLVRRHHPDTGGDPARFLEIQAAWEALRREPAQPPQPAPAPPAPAVHRMPAAPSALRDPSPAACVAAISLAAVGAAASLATAALHAPAAFAAAFAAGLLLHATSRALALRQGDRARRHRRLWAYGFVLPRPELVRRVARTHRLAAVGLGCARLSLAASLGALYWVVHAAVA